jgi:hypothetical protein
VPDEFVNRLQIAASGVQLNNDSLPQFDGFGAAEDHVTYGSAVSLCDETAVGRLRAGDEAPIEKSRVARDDHGVISPRSLPELVDGGAEVINLDDPRGLWSADLLP